MAFDISKYPKFNEYPGQSYKILMILSGNIAVLHSTGEDIAVFNDGESQYLIFIKNSSVTIDFLQEDQWVSQGTDTGSMGEKLWNTNIVTILWANYDIYYAEDPDNGILSEDIYFANSLKEGRYSIAEDLLISLGDVTRILAISEEKMTPIGIQNELMSLINCREVKF